MKIIVTGGAGFLGQRIATALLSQDSLLPCTKLVLADVVQPTLPEPWNKDLRVKSIAIDISSAGAAEKLIQADTDVIFHLAAIVSGHAEQDFEFGFNVNLDATRKLLEVTRKVAPKVRFVFTSTCAVYGGTLPEIVREDTALTPENSYGVAKAMCELLIGEYSRRGFLDTRAVRLPTVTVRPGTANAAVTSFASGIIREPLSGKEAICPVPLDTKIWITSPRSVVRNIIYAAVLTADKWKGRRVISLPGLTVSVREMIEALRKTGGEAAVKLIKFQSDERQSRIVLSLPTKFDVSRALALGFDVDKNFEDIIKDYIETELKINKKLVD